MNPLANLREPSFYPARARRFVGASHKVTGAVLAALWKLDRRCKGGPGRSGGASCALTRHGRVRVATDTGRMTMARRWARAHRRRPYGTLNLTPLREATISSRQVSRALRDVLSFTSRDPAILRAARNRLRSPCKCAVNLKE